MASINSIIESVKNNTIGSKLSLGEGGTNLNEAQCDELAKALVVNTTVTSVDLCNKGLDASCMKGFPEVIKQNKTITALDIGYNNISGEAIVDLCNALKENTTLTELKIHRQAKDYGTTCETKIVTLWDKNTTLTRMYATLHDRSSNRANTAAEVRNKEISNRKAAGKDWRDLNPDPVTKQAYLKEKADERAAEQAAEAAANAPISEKIPSRGGPYSMKELTCAIEFLADDVDTSKKESFLSDEEFLEVFKMDKEKFAAAQKWKQNGLKKENKLH